MGSLRAVDTNVVARYVLDDDPIQSPIAAAVMQEPVYLSDTVILETAWLLSSRYRVGRADLVSTLEDLLKLPGVSVSDPTLIGWAIERFAAGADFADMMHLISSRHADHFASFEAKLDVLAGGGTPIPVVPLG